MVGTEPQELVIRSEEEAWAALRAAAEGKPVAEGIRVRFEGWPTFEVGYQGRDWHGTVPTRVMPSLLEVQRVISRAYVQVQYDESRLLRLHEDERDDLELVVKVRKGSSVFDVELWKQLSRIGEAAVQRMSGPETVITVLGVALLIAAPVMYRTWVDKRKQEREIAGRVELSKQETARFQLMTETLQHNAVLRTTHDDVQAASSKLLKATRSGDAIQRHAISLPAEEAHTLSQPDAERARPVEFAGSFTIRMNQTDKGAGFRITACRTTDNLTITADVAQELPWDQQEAIRNAEWAKRPVELVIDAEMLRDRITRAVVLSAVAVAL